MKTALIDYGAGNIRSVARALDYIKEEYTIIDNGKNLSLYDQLVFPGVGEARSAMDALKKRGFDTALPQFFKSGKKMLGICLGCQIILSFSEERNTDCLDLIPGRAVRFPDSVEKVPHMGWNTVRYKEGSALFDGIKQEASFYFVHSYYPEPDLEENSLAQCEYILSFSCALQKDNIYAVQFHPEKSGENGLKLLENFYKIPG